MMRKHTAFLILILVVMLVSACGPSAPKDGKYGDQRDFLPTNEDLMSAGLNFSLTKKNDTFETTNEEMMKSEYYDEEDKALIFDLGRETEWSRGFSEIETSTDGDNTKRVMVICSVTSFKTPDGAKSAVERFNEVELDRFAYISKSYEYINRDLNIGDTYVIYATTDSYIFNALYIEFAVRNIAVKVWLMDSRDVGIAEVFARIIFERIQNSTPTIAAETGTTLTDTNTPDMRVLDDKIENFLPTNGHVSEIGYKEWQSENGWVEYSNDLLMSSSDYDAEDRAEIFEFGRVTEFFQFLSNNANAKEEAVLRLVIYKNNDGARKAWNNSKGTIELIGNNVNKTLNIGDSCVSYTWMQQDTYYNNVEFVFKNVKAEVVFWDSQKDSQLLKTAETFARYIFENIQIARFVDPSEASFTNFVNSEPARDVTKTGKSYGFYLVGSEIAPGNWRNSGNSDGCYWAITDSKGEIIENFIGMTGGTMYVPTSAYQVQLEKECGMWEYLGN